jgi:hypothetical protein
MSNLSHHRRRDDSDEQTREVAGRWSPHRRGTTACSHSGGLPASGRFRSFGQRAKGDLGSAKALTRCAAMAFAYRRSTTFASAAKIS